MKFKVRGLVFVGFAAAILSANAMAANEAQTVTSKAYTEATYQHKSTAASIGNSSGTWTPLDQTIPATGGESSAPTSAAVRAALSTATNVDNFVEDVITDGVTTKAPSENAVHDALALKEDSNNKVTSMSSASTDAQYPSAKAVYDALNGAEHANFQTYSETANQISNGAGGWKNLDNVIDATTASSASAPTTAAVKTYVDNKATAAASDILADTQDATDNDHALTNAATTTALAGKQNLQTGDTYQVSKNGSWTAANGAVQTGAHITKTDNADGSVTVAVDDITSAAADINNTDTGLTTGAAVYDFVTGKIEDATGNNQIPAQNPAVCTSEHPCALVNEGGTLHWYTMAQADYAGGDLGDATPANP